MIRPPHRTLIPQKGSCSQGHRASSSPCLLQAEGTSSSQYDASVYFLSHLDGCDHIFLFPDGRFERVALHGSGTWILTQLDGGNVMQLELLWKSGQGAKSELFTSTGKSASSFASEGGKMVHVDGHVLAPESLDEQAQVYTTKKRGLVFSSVGSQCLPVVRDTWLSEPDSMDFDVSMVFYKEEESLVYRVLADIAANNDAVHLQHNKDMKWPNFKRWMEANGGAAAIAAAYDYVWVVDDDVRLPTREINKMFAILRDHPNVQFACPALDAGSDGVWRYFDGHAPGQFLRYTDFVECTAPVIKTSMLLDAQFSRCLQAVQTGCFIDFCFYPVTGGQKDAVAIIDAVQCHHPPRGSDSPSEMRQVKAWEDHKDDQVFFQQAGIPKEWYWWRQPQVFSSIPASAAPRNYDL